MLLAIDIGNSMVTLGVFDGERLDTTLRVTTDTRRLADEYGLLITNLLNLKGVEPSRIEDICMCSVVPPLTQVFERVCEAYFGLKPLTVSTGVRTGLQIHYDNPRDVGSDRIVDAVAAIKRDEFKIVISCIKEKLIYDIREFTTRTGQKVTVTFKNSDFPPHNLLFVKPGTGDEVAALALALGAEGFAKKFRPDTDKILWGSTMLEQGQEATINFVAPAPGDYPYICTFPGHHILMRGVMHVVKE